MNTVRKALIEADEDIAMLILAARDLPQRSGTAEVERAADPISGSRIALS